MNEFLAKMKTALEDEQIPEYIVNEHIRYYHDYIQSELNNGKLEQEILNELGDPRLLAKTILETQTQNGQSQYGSKAYSDAVDAENGTYTTGNGDTDKSYDRQKTEGLFHVKHGIRGCLVSIVVIMCILAILKVVLSFAFFFAIPLAIIVLLIILFRKLGL